MKELTHISLFSGIGGLDLAAEAAGFTTKAQVEINPFVTTSSNFDSRKPSNSPISEKLGGGDLLKVCGGESPTVLSGGFPCQPVSIAGKRKGSEDIRWLWPEYFRLIREIKPAWIVAENVAALLNIPEFTGIYNDLKKEGYEIAPIILAAADAGAPHKRKRCFVVAHSHSVRESKNESGQKSILPGLSRPDCICGTDSSGIHKAVNPDGLAGLQANKSANTFGKEGRTRNSITGKYRKVSSLPDWKTYPPAICRMDDGFSPGVDKLRLQALGNAVVPRIAYPIFECIARIEG